MLISSHGRFIFVHVQKTGGVSLEHVLRSHYPDTSSWHGRHGHARSGLEELGIDRWKSYFSFGFVRNPWDRLVSYYSMIRVQIDALPPEERKSPRPFDLEIWNQVARNSHDFESFLDNCTETVFDRGCYKSFLFQQIDYLTDASGTVCVDQIGRYESFEEDAACVLRRIGIEVNLPMLNRSTHGHYQDYYTERTRKLVADRFARDIEQFGYSF